MRWEKNGAILDIDRDQRLTIETPPGNLVIRNLNKSDAMRYVCVGRNEAGEEKSDPAILQVYGKLSRSNCVLVLYN